MPNNLEIDVVTHSRGGLVGRELLSRVQQGIPLRVRKMIMVACPNRGTPLADGEHWLTMLDRYTSLLADLPDTSASVIMEGILTVVKLIGHAGLRKLPGLAAMTPKTAIYNNSMLVSLVKPKFMQWSPITNPTTLIDQTFYAPTGQ